ncbi:MAG: hypothetical protein KDB38_12445, partial [Nocardioidaceae bacterium]|nr:hypothetical protein [Nocardioidaceae bacterium]
TVRNAASLARAAGAVTAGGLLAGAGVAAGELLGVGVAGADVVERAEGGCWGSAAQPTRTIRPNTRAVDLRMISLPG